MIQIISIGERGLAVTFDKWDLIEIKNGNTLHGELVGGNGKTKIMFMRDSTFKDMQRKFEKKVQQLTEVNEVTQAAESLGDSLV